MLQGNPTVLNLLLKREARKIQEWQSFQEKQFQVFE